MTRLVTVPFRGDTLFAIEADDGVFVAIKPIADRLGLDWSAQLKRTKRDPLLAKGMAIMTIPSPGGSQDATCLRLRLLPGWLFGIGANQVREEARPLVLLYQDECHEALFRHFLGPQVEGATIMGGPSPMPAREEPVRIRRQLVTEARQTFGERAAGSLWFALGLPVVPEMRAAPAQGDFGFTYTAVPAPPPDGGGGPVTASDRPAGMDYAQYIASPVWARLRSEALIRDGYRCRGCGSSENLEVHHRRYGNPLGSETVDDLTTLCGGPEGCHHAITDVIRRRRYGERPHVVAPVARLAPGRQEQPDVPQLRALEVQAHRRVTPGHAQRAAGEPSRPVRQGAEGGERQAGEDGRRLRGDGAD